MKSRAALALAAAAGGIVLGIASGCVANPRPGSSSRPEDAVVAQRSPHRHAGTALLAPRPPTTAAPRSPAVSPRPAAAVRTVRAQITGYGYFDNTPPGSARISNPVLHRSAGGTGSYADPITVAVGHSLATGKDVLDWPAGTRFYLPNLRRYLLVEDTCGDGATPESGPCHTGYPAAASTWLDIWTGGKGGGSAGADECMNAITRVSTVVVAPAAGYPVVSGDIYGPAGCSRQYGDTFPAR